MASYRRHLTITRPIPRSTSTSSRASHVMATTNTPSTTRSALADTTSRWSLGGTEQRRPATMRAAKGPRRSRTSKKGSGRGPLGNYVNIAIVGYGERFPQHRRHRHCHDDRPGDRGGAHVEFAPGGQKGFSYAGPPVCGGVPPAGPHRWASAR